MKTNNTLKILVKYLSSNAVSALCGLVLGIVFLPITAMSAVLDWDANNWPLPSLGQTYSVGGSNININLSGNTGQLNTTGNPASPETNQHLTGGTTNQDALFIRTDFVNTTEEVVITIDFTHPGGVSDLSFTFWDVDADIPQWNDELRVTATANGSTVNPSSVSNGVTNSPIGANGSIGDPADNNNAANNTADGNVTFTFNQTRITQVTIVYSNATTGTPGNQWISLHDLAFDVAPTITKQFSPSTIATGDISTLTITLDNNDTNAATLTSNLVDSLPTGVTVASPTNIGGTCPGTTNATVGGNTITYTSGSAIPVGGCTISVDVTSFTTGTVTNTIAADALQTNLGNNSSSASDDLTVTSGGGAATCPAGTTLVNLATPRNADAVVLGTGVPNSTQALGPILGLGSPTSNGNSARLTSGDPTLVLDLTDTIPENGIIILSVARNNASGNYDIDASSDNVGFAGAITYAAGPDDISQQASYTVPAGGARYIRFDRNAGSLWVDGIQYSQICQSPPSADLVISKDDGGITTYTPGGTTTYLITVTNNGPDNATGASVNDVLPRGVTFNGAVTCIANGTANCGTIATGNNGGDGTQDFFNATGVNINAGAGNSVVYTVPVQFSTNMTDY